MMDVTLQKIAREAGTLSTENHTGINIGPELEASAESSNVHVCCFNAHRNPNREAPRTSTAPDSPLASSGLLRFTSDGDGVLHIAASFGNVQLVREIREWDETLAAALLAAVNNIGDTPLHCAAARGSEGMVDLFVKEMMEGVNGRAKFLRAKNLNGETCLHKAVRHGLAGIVETLISEDNKLDESSSPRLVQIVDNKGISPLYLATTLRNIEIVKALTGRPYQQEDKYAASYAGPEGQTALHAAVVLLDKELINVLLGWNEGLTQQEDETGSTPLHFLALLSWEHSFFKQGREKGLGVVKLILGKDPLSALRADYTGSLPIHVAAAHGRLDMIKELLKECPSCDSSRNASGQTFLHVAVEKKKIEIVDYVCREEKLVRLLNSEDQDGNTALHLAVNNGSEKIFWTLMRNRDVCLSFKNKEGRTPLDLAFLRRRLEVNSSIPEAAQFYEGGTRKRIFFGLLDGGGDFGVCSWDRLTGNIVEPDWEKESAKVDKSASVLAVCSVLIWNGSLAVPFSVLSNLNKTGINTGPFLPLFVAMNTCALVFSGAATFFCARAGFAMSDVGFAMSDVSTRRKNLAKGKFCLGIAAIAYVYTVGAALSGVLRGLVGLIPLLAVSLVLVIGFRMVGAVIKHTRTHRSAVRSRIGFYDCLASGQ